MALGKKEVAFIAAGVVGADVLIGGGSALVTAKILEGSRPAVYGAQRPGRANGTPRPSESPATANPSATAGSAFEHEFKAGETSSVPANTFCGGDVVVDGDRYYVPGSDGRQGNIVILPKGGRVYAQWGADCKTETPAALGSFIEEMKGDMVGQGIPGGCGNASDGCGSVDIWKQKGTKVGNVQPDDNPTFEHKFKPGETANVPAGSECLGDIQVNGQPYYDGKNAGHITEVRRGGRVYAQWGADCKTESPSGLGSAVLQMLNHGGVNNAGVKNVIVYKEGHWQLQNGTIK